MSPQFFQRLIYISLGAVESVHYKEMTTIIQDILHVYIMLGIL